VSNPLQDAKDKGWPIVVSYGVGVDSTAMLVGMAAQRIRPDLILFSDTGSEWPDTYAYLKVIGPWLERVGFPLITVTRYKPTEKINAATYVSLYDNCINNQTLPGLAYGKKSCSMKFKREPMDKLVLASFRGVENIARCIGYDAGPIDSKRAWKIADEKPFRYVYPLREWGWARPECMEQIRRAGLPVPHKSACFFCPAMKPSEVRDVVERHPHLADMIIAMEAAAIPWHASRAERGIEDEGGGSGKTTEGLWGHRRSFDGRPGTMTEYINSIRAGRLDPCIIDAADETAATLAGPYCP